MDFNAEQQAEFLIATTQKLNRLFDLGWRVGKAEGLNQPISLQSLKQLKKDEFEEKERLLKELLSEMVKVSSAALTVK